jgi:hypothetical protein
MPVLSWNESETEQLMTLFHEGVSFSQIAKAIGSKTKNSCVGKSKRLGLPHRGHIMACERFSPAGRPRIRETAETSRPVPPVHSRDYRCTIIELRDRSCRYPLWSDTGEGERLYCGRPSARLSEARPYCATHAKLTFHTR